MLHHALTRNLKRLFTLVLAGTMVSQGVWAAPAQTTPQAEAAHSASATPATPVAAPVAALVATAITELPNPTAPQLGVDPRMWSIAASAEIIAAADRTPVSAYLGSKGQSISPELMLKFEQVFSRVAHANQEIGINDDASGFDSWFKRNEVSAIFQRDQMGPDVSLQMFFMNLFKAYKIESTNAAQDATAFSKWLNGVVQNPYVRAVSQNTYVDATATLLFFWGVIRGAFTAGPAAGVVNAFTDKLMTPVMQKVGLLGSKLLGPAGVYLNNYLFSGDVKMTKENGEEVHDKVEQLNKGYREARVQLNALGYDVSPTKYSKTFSKFYLSWNWFQQIFSQTHPNNMQGGRAAAFDALGFRPKDFARDVIQATTAIEVQRQGIDQIVDRIIARQQTNPQQLEAAVNESFKALELVYEQPSSQPVPREILQKAERAGQHLIELGASPQQALQIVSNQRHTLIVTRFAASTLAAHISHDLQYDEYNRALPPEFYQLSNAMRANFGLDYFHYQFGQQVIQILHQTGVELEIASGRVNEAMKTLAGIDPSARTNESARALSVVDSLGSDAGTEKLVGRTAEINRENSSGTDTRVKDAVSRSGKK